MKDGLKFRNTITHNMNLLKSVFSSTKTLILLQSKKKFYNFTTIEKKNSTCKINLHSLFKGSQKK